MSNDPEKNIDATEYDECAICGERIALYPVSPGSRITEWVDSEAYSEGDDGHAHTPCEPDGAPAEQWEVTTPAAVYWNGEGEHP